MEHLLFEIEQPLIPILIEMEKAGIAVDAPYLQELSREITDRLQQVEIGLNYLAGRPINPNSARQLAPLLFDELKLPSGRRTKTGFSVDSEVLENIRDRDPIVERILEHRSLAKLEVDLRGRAAAAGQQAHRSRPHLVQPDGRGNWSSLRPTPTCRTFRSTRAGAAECGGPSSLTTAGVPSLR